MPLFSSTAPTYRKVLEIAKGGMGRVDLVVRRQENFERLYAIKRLRETYLDDEEIRQMFVDEARIAGLIRHPNVVSVTDVGEDAEGPFLVMDYVDGVSLGALLNKLLSTSTTLPMTVALNIMAQVADGINAAHTLCDGDGHELRVIHRDVSPQNVLVGFDGFARVTDFGIAKAFGRSTKTQTGVLKGKMGYLSPEALRFEDLDQRSDIFSIGVVLYELLTMSRLYSNRNGMEGARAILHEPPPDLADEIEHAPDALVELVMSLLAKLPEHRPQTAAEVGRRLRAVLRDVELDLPPADIADFLADTFGEERAERARTVEAARRDLANEPRRRRSRLALLALAPVLLLGLGGAYYLSQAGKVGEEPASVSTSEIIQEAAVGEPNPAAQTAEASPATPDENVETVVEAVSTEQRPTARERARSRQRQRERAAAQWMRTRATPMWDRE